MREIRCSNAGALLRPGVCSPVAARSDVGEMRANNSVGVLGGGEGRAPHAKSAQKTGHAEEPRPASGRFWSFPETLWSVPMGTWAEKTHLLPLPSPLPPGLAWWWPRWPGPSEQGSGAVGAEGGRLESREGRAAGSHIAPHPRLLSRSLTARDGSGQRFFRVWGCQLGGEQMRCVEESGPAAAPCAQGRVSHCDQLGFPFNRVSRK